jgi:hypothetical protein
MANKFVSPKGRASYPKLTKPDTKFNPEGVYSTGLIIPKEAAAPFQAIIEEAFVEEFGQKALPKANWPWSENEEGELVFKFKSKNKPTLFDSKGKPIKSDLNIGSGSVLKVAGGIGCRQVSGKYYATLYLNSVQVIELVEFSSSAFGEEEGGFVADDDEEAVTSSPSAEKSLDF